MSLPSDPESLEQLLASLSADGRDFERLCAWFLQSDPEYANEFEHVWLWDDWPTRWGRDKGIDLIAQTYDGRILAVQAKKYAAKYSVKKADLDSFLAESSRDVIDERLLIATTDLVGANAREVISGQSKPVSECLLSRLRAALVTWPTNVGELRADAPIHLEPKPHQQVALDAIEAWSQTSENRGQVLMACGTGKTLISVRAADLLQARHVLVLVPTLPLLRQTASAWAAQSKTVRRSMRVCSDQNDGGSEQVASVSELGFPTTTDPQEVGAFLQASAPRIIFATYKSSPVIEAAMAVVPDICFDLVVADEAHQCAGAARKASKTVLDGERIRSKRRLFFTATPTLFAPREKQQARAGNVALASMDDRELFGPVVHHLSFADAVAEELLCPYQVVVMPIRSREVQALIDDRRLVTADGDRIFEASVMATQIACARAMRKYGARRIVAFHPRIQDARSFAEHFPRAAALLPEAERPIGTIWSEHVDGGGMSRSRRIRVLREFDVRGDDFRILSNVRLLTEGVDIPAVDGVAFVHTSRGSVSVIQAVGRAMRTAPGKEIGTIILPILVRNGEDIDGALKRAEHRDIVRVLGALRSHDPDIFRSLDHLRYTAGRTRADDSEVGNTVRRFVIDAPVDVDAAFADAVDVALSRALGTAGIRRPRRRRADEPIQETETRPLTDEEIFERGYDVLRRWSHGRLAPTVPESFLGFPLGTWWNAVKARWQNGEIDSQLKTSIADAVSWLAPDLGAPDSLMRREMQALTSAEVAEQLDVQLSRQGMHATGPFASLVHDSRDFFDPDGALDWLELLSARVTHPAMSPRMQLLYLTVALRPLALSVADLEDPWKRQAAVEGFLDRIEQTPEQERHWVSASEPEAYMLGYAAATPLSGLVARMALYRFVGDELDVLTVRAEEVLMEVNDRLDALGWDIFLLARHQGFSVRQAIAMGRPGPPGNDLATRLASRDQLLTRERLATKRAEDWTHQF